MCAWRLPGDARCASAARSLLGLALAALGVDRETAGDATLAVSELATNALNHGLRAVPHVPVVPPELWVWARATPAPQLVVSVFDTCTASWPDTTPRNLLDEHGKGLGIVGALAAAWGAHPSRSSVVAGGVPGKAVWSAFPLPGPWPDARTTAQPARIARHLADALTARGVRRIAHRPGEGVSLLSVPLRAGAETNVWVEPGHLSFPGRDGTRVRRPVIDLYDVAEDLVHRAEQERGHG
ncbi:hypothetical protein DPM19_28535 [Actinomadura craniellae]|uniref:Histidine kinase/HSP90-like ATPase domain-containing protein n=2 Tax=Actinomadura craniellae TaxID=2231787 RepID=A0A365H141_9ACTN|nr:hypothetical protein DPM19_28535 [Actinomadura craniellae]